MHYLAFEKKSIDNESYIDDIFTLKGRSHMRVNGFAGWSDYKDVYSLQHAVENGPTWLTLNPPTSKRVQNEESCRGTVVTRGKFLGMPKNGFRD